MGDKDYLAIKKNEEDMYIANFTPNKAEYMHKLKKVLVNGKLALPIFASDHFGVVATLSIE